MKVHMFRAVQFRCSPEKENLEVAWIEILPVIKETNQVLLLHSNSIVCHFQARKVSNFLFFSMSFLDTFSLAERQSENVFRYFECPIFITNVIQRHLFN
jgi:hypothetical protein